MATEGIEGTNEFLNADRVTKLVNRYTMTTFSSSNGASAGLVVFDTVTGKVWMTDPKNSHALLSCRYPGNSVMPKSD